MIREHAFNSIWWQGRVGILEDPAFFERPEAERRAELEPYEWVEFRCPLASAPDPWSIARAGFVWADAQIGFRIALPAEPAIPGSERPLVAANGLDGVLVSWGSIRTQSIGPHGELRWGANGVAVCDGAWPHTPPQLVSDGHGGAYEAWGDRRGAPVRRGAG